MNFTLITVGIIFLLNPMWGIYDTDISYHEYGLYGESYMGAYSYCPDGSAMTYVPMNNSQQTSNAKSGVNVVEISPKSGFTK